MTRSDHSTFGIELPQLLERLHRRFLDVVRIELTRIGVRDINPVQILMLAAIGQNEDMAVRDLIDRGYYLGSNVSYNIKNLSESGYIERFTDPHDRRSARVRITGKGRPVLEKLQSVTANLAAALITSAEQSKDCDATLNFLRRFERECSIFIESR